MVQRYGLHNQAFFALVKNRWEKQQSSYFLSRIIQRSEANGFSDSPGMLCSIFICFHVTWGKNTFLFVTVCNKSKKREKSDMLQHRSNIVLKVQQGTRLYFDLTKKATLFAWFFPLYLLLTPKECLWRRQQPLKFTRPKSRKIGLFCTCLPWNGINRKLV